MISKQTVLRLMGVATLFLVSLIIPIPYVSAAGMIAAFSFMATSSVDGAQSS